jgi:hypothetical protein
MMYKYEINSRTGQVEDSGDRMYFEEDVTSLGHCAEIIS